MKYQTIITPDALANNLQTPNWLILDCRGSLLSDNKGYKNYIHNHIPNAYYYCSLGYTCFDTTTPNGCGYIPSEPLQMLEKLREWGFDESSQIIIYEDLNSSFTDAMWLKFRSLGLENVAVLQGGFTSWQDYGYPTTIDGTDAEQKKTSQTI